MKEYIEREAAIMSLCAKIDEPNHAEFLYCDEIYNVIHAIPTADVVEVRHGHWVWDENGMDWGLGAWKCSECHRKPETWWEADKGNPYRCAGSSYCNHCGAKMDGGDE